MREVQPRGLWCSLGERARFPPGLAGGLLNNNRARMVTSNNIRLQIPVGNATPQRRKSISATTSYHLSPPPSPPPPFPPPTTLLRRPNFAAVSPS